MFDRTYVKKSGQLWKLAVVGSLTVIGLALMWLGQRRLGESPSSEDSGLIMLVVGVGLGLASGVWAVWAVRCPRCGSKLLWRAVSEQDSGSWLQWLMAQDECPSCRPAGAPDSAMAPIEPR
jgi:hypothetical protein